MVTFDLINQNLVIITNPKSGVTTTNNLLADILHEDFRRYDSLDSKIIIQNKRAAFVFRNPYERVVSMFFRFNRVLWTDPTGVRGNVTKEILKRYRKKDGFNFPDFLTYLKETPNDKRDIHYRSQDIPERYDRLILTDRYFEGMLIFFREVGYSKAIEKLSEISAEEIIANKIKKSDVKEWEDVLRLRTYDYEKFEKPGYPPYSLYFNSETVRAIDDIFHNEVQLYHTAEGT